MTTPTEEQPFVVSECDGIPVAAVAGHSDERQVVAAFEALGDVIADSDESDWVIDMAQVDYLSSEGFGRLMALHKKAETCGVEVRFAAVRPEIVAVLEIMLLNDVISLYPTVEEACTSVSA